MMSRDNVLAIMPTAEQTQKLGQKKGGLMHLVVLLTNPQRSFLLRIETERLFTFVQSCCPNQPNI